VLEAIAGDGIDVGSNPFKGGGPVPLNVLDVELEAIAGDGVVLLGKTPFKGGGPVPLIVYVTAVAGPGTLDEDDNVVM
jgi:hypothetical protein